MHTHTHMHILITPTNIKIDFRYEKQNPTIVYNGTFKIQQSVMSERNKITQ